MSVFIKGLEMPQNCSDCPLNYDQMACKVTGTRWWSDTMVLMGFDSDKERLYDCPLVEIPTPHGRLIDADELIRELASEHVDGLDAIKKYTNANTWTSGLHTAWRLIDDAETVVEVEGSET